MKKYTFFIIAIFAITSFSFAQNNANQKAVEKIEEAKKTEEVVRVDIPNQDNGSGQKMEKAPEPKSNGSRHEESNSSITPEEKAENQTKKLINAAALTDDQILRVKNIFLNNAQKIQAINDRFQGASDKNQMNREIKNLKTESEKALRNILTSEQYSAYLLTRE